MMGDEELEKEIVKLFDRLGKALFSTIRDATSPTGDDSTSRRQWQQVGRQLIKVAKESE